MAKSSIDELISAIKAVQVLEQIVARHDRAIEKIVDKLDTILCLRENPKNRSAELQH